MKYLEPSQEYLLDHLRNGFLLKSNKLRAELAECLHKQKLAQAHEKAISSVPEMKDFLVFIAFLISGLCLFVFFPISMVFGIESLKIISGLLFFVLGSVGFFGVGPSKARKARKRPFSEERDSFVRDEWRIKNLLLENLEKGLKARVSVAEKQLIDGDQSALAKKEFVAASRAFYEYERRGPVTMYDESRIQNDLQSLTETITKVFHGDNIDNSRVIHVDSVNFSTVNVNNSPEQEQALTLDSDVKRMILKSLKSSKHGSMSVTEFYVAIRASQKLINDCLSSLSQQGLILVTNREDGVLVYKIDELFI